jgi:His-Xaa-Ser system radical SAM maturase HxsC
MIRLRLKAQFPDQREPFVAKLNAAGPQGAPPNVNGPVARTWRDERGRICCDLEGYRFSLLDEPETSVDGDVFILVPKRGVAMRLIRRGSIHNSLLFTERCDQLCVMCSQPPKRSNDSWLFPLYRQAIALADEGSVIGITGGEPTLYKDELLALLSYIAEVRPDIQFHILSNGQHLTRADVPALRSVHERLKIQWGIPLYSSEPGEHNEIVGKAGAFARLMEGLLLLGASGANIELRTVVLKKNVLSLARLAAYVGRNLDFVRFWAIMATEPIGYAKANFDDVYFDHSIFFAPVGAALDMARLFDIETALYNFPHCTVPAEYRRACVSSISDWKNKYLPVCEGCEAKSACCGFFEWYNSRWRFEGVKAIKGGN